MQKPHCEEGNTRPSRASKLLGLKGPSIHSHRGLILKSKGRAAYSSILSL